MPKITKRAVDELQQAGFLRTLRDEELRGFGCRLNRDGSLSYLVEYRAGRGRAFPVRRMVIGRHGALTPDEARRQAKMLLAAVARGGDPAAQRNAAKAESTVRELLQHALERHWRPKRKLSTVVSFEQIVNGRLIPSFGEVRVTQLRRSEIRRWHAELSHIPIRANRALAVLRKALSLAVEDELITTNPAKGIIPHPEKARSRVPSDGELRAIWAACDDGRIAEPAALLFKLLILTGCRTGEWRTARRQWVDITDRVLRLPDAKSGSRDVPLSPQALSLVAANRGEWVIPNRSGSGPLTTSGVRDAWRAIRQITGVDDLRVHDLRHGFGTRAAGLGANALVLRDALGHRSLAMTNRYVSRQTNPVRDIANRIGAHVEGIIKRRAPVEC